MNPIVIGYDGSPGAKAAIAFAAEHLARRPAVVVTAYEAWPPAVRGDAAVVDDDARAATEQAAEEGAALARAAGLDAAARTVYGSRKPWQSIIDVADELDAGLIVVGSHGFNGLRPLVLGSVSHQLGHHAHQPVLAVPTAEAVAARKRQKAVGNATEHAVH